MKNIKANLLAACIIALSVHPVLIKAQSLAYRTAAPDTHGEKKAAWQPAKLDDSGNNLRNGVEFYTQYAVCSIKKAASTEKTTFEEPHHHSVTPDMYISQEVDLVKLVNTNNYAVRVSYQESDFSPVVNILVPPSAIIEGACDSKDDNLTKLVIKTMPNKTDEEKQKTHIKSSLLVTKIQ